MIKMSTHTQIWIVEDLHLIIDTLELQNCTKEVVLTF